MSRIFSDYDGCFDTFPEIRKVAEAIITGNSWQNADDVFGIEIPQVPVFFNPIEDKDNNQQKIIMHKAEIINRCKVTRFFEDIPQEATALRLLCTDCQIILVPKGGGKLNI